MNVDEPATYGTAFDAIPLRNRGPGKLFNSEAGTLRRLALPLAALFLVTGCDSEDPASPVVTAKPHAALSAAAAVTPTLTVNSTNDVDDGTCNTTHCSLREAIDDANSATGLDIIHFNISGVLPHTIQPLSPLPTVTDPVVIDGTSQPGFAGKPVIEIDGSKAGLGKNGLEVTAGSSTVRGLVINRFLGWNPYAYAIALKGKGNNVVEGNFVGTDVTGTKALTNAGIVIPGDLSNAPGSGILVDGSADNTIGGTTASARNVVSGNYRGISITGTGATGNLVQGNHVGTDVTGTVNLGNGVRVQWSSGVSYDLNVGIAFVFASNNTIGGTAAGARNLISGNLEGVAILCAQNNAVQGNYIGTNVTGTAAIPNEDGVAINAIGNTCVATGNLIGGTNAQARNLISGNINGVFLSATDQADLSGTLVQGNYIGTDPAGVAALPNSVGVYIYGADASQVTVGGTAAGAGNVISGNKREGVSITSAKQNLVQGNYIGTNAVGNAALGNETGVALATEFGVSSFPRNNTIGGTHPGARNVISGNTKYGIGIAGGQDNEIQGNYIGTNAAGAAALKNGSGVVLASSGSMGTTMVTKNNTIGGTTPGAGNVISGNGKYGIYFGGAGPNQVLGNYIGTNASGTVAMANGLDGIAVVDAEGNTIGGTASGAGNVISGNTRIGIIVSGTKSKKTKVQGNLIGTDPTGTSAVGNGNSGVRIDQGSENTIGGTAVGAGNVIAFNGSAGVAVSTGTGNAILSNAIFSNTGLGIDLGVVPGTSNPNGMTPNDVGDGDTGPNGLQNFPVLGTFGTSGGTPTVQGTLNSAASSAFRVELFVNAACDVSGYGEGATYLGSTTATTAGTGNASFSINVSGSVAKGEYLTATATDGSDNTSELSKCLVVPNQPPVADADGPYDGAEGSAVSFDGTGSSDPDGDPLSFAWSFGDGGSANSTATPSHTYADNGSYNVGLQVDDPDGLSDTDATTATIANVAPAVAAGPDAVILSGQSHTVSATFTDPGVNDAPWQYGFGWGDGTSESGTTNDQSAALSGKHGYLVPGDYAVTVSVTDKDGDTGSAGLTVTVKPIPVTIDVKPGSDPNSINCGRDREIVTVAVLSTADFDAMSVDHTTVLFAGASEFHIDRKTGQPQRHEEDVDRDGDIDLVVHFRLGDTSLDCGSTEGTLTGVLFDGRYVEGTHEVRMSLLPM